MINIVKCECLGGGCPTQWDMVDDKGKRYYARYRWGTLNVWDYDTIEINYFSKKYGGQYDGTMSFEELKDLLTSQFKFECEES